MTVIGSAGIDTIDADAGDTTTITGGGDVIDLSGGTTIDTIHFTATSNFGDTVANFDIGTGAGKDDITLDNSFAGTGLAGAVTFRTAVAFNTTQAITLADLTTDAGTDAEGYIVELTGSTLGTTLYDAIDTAMAAGTAAVNAGFILMDNGTHSVLLYDADFANATAGSVVVVGQISGVADITAGTDVVIA